MKKELSKTETKEKIESFMKKDSFTSEEMKKIKRLAMSHRLSLKNYKKFFCKKCLSKLHGKTRISKTHKTIECQECNYKNKIYLISPVFQ